MDLRSLPDGLSPSDRCSERCKRIETELGVDLSALAIDPEQLGTAEERNCENMFGHVPIPVGLAGPLKIVSDDGEREIYVPLATTEGALVASVNRGCKALTQSGGAKTSSTHHGTSRSLAFKLPPDGVQSFVGLLKDKEDDWKKIGEATSNHLRVLSFTIDEQNSHVFLTIYCDTDEAMGMNMVTIAAASIGEWAIAQAQRSSLRELQATQFITVAGNVDSDKKPSKRTFEHGRGYEVTASATVPSDVIERILKSSPEALLAVAEAKLTNGSAIAGAIGKNLHAANIVAACYLATGQDAAHVVEGSLAETIVQPTKDGIEISTRLPALMVGIRGGGTTLPAQQQCLNLLLGQGTNPNPCSSLAQSIAAAVLAGELSLLAAQANHQLAKAHSELGR